MKEQNADYVHIEGNDTPPKAVVFTETFTAGTTEFEVEPPMVTTEDINRLINRLLTAIEAVNPDPGTNRPTKQLIKNIVWDWYGPLEFTGEAYTQTVDTISN